MFDLIRDSNRPPEQFNDGLLQYGVIETERENGKKIGEKFNRVGKLYFNRMTIRQSDYDLQEGATSQGIDLKVKTYFVKDVSKDAHQVLIGDTKFNIYQIDADNDDKYLYWYLSKEGRLNGQRDVKTEEVP